MSDTEKTKVEKVKIITETPSCVTDKFVGRTKEIGDIKGIINSGKNNIVVLRGIGGIGKTEICRKIFWGYENNNIGDIHYVGWIKFDKRLDNSFYDAFKDVKKAGSVSDYIEKVNELFRKYGRELLLIIDNAEDIKSDDIIKIAAIPCRVIITSRKALGNLHTYDIPELDEDSCIELYMQHSGEKDKEKIREIVRLSLHHTITLELLAKYQKNRYLTAAELLKQLESKGFTIDDNVNVDVLGHHEKTAAINEHLNIIFDLSEFEGKEAEQKILAYFSLFAPNTPVNVRTAMEIFGTDNEFNALNCLIEGSWLKDEEDRCVSMHPVISDVVRAKLKPTYDEAEEMIEQLWIKADDLREKNYVEMKAILPHCLAVYENYKENETENIGWLLNSIAGIYRATGEYSTSLKYYDKAVNIMEKIFGTDRPDTAVTYNNIACVYRDMGEYEKALEYYEKSLNIKENVLGTEHPDTATTYNNVAGVYKGTGEYKKAMEYYEKAIKIREKVFGTEHLNTATTYNNIAGVYQDTGEYKKALEYSEKALKIVERFLGTDHPNTATTYYNIASVYQDMGEYKKALEYYEKALNIREKVLGTEHPNTATTYNNIALLYNDMGEYEKALEYYKKALNIKEKVFGADHPDTINVKQGIKLTEKAMKENGETNKGE